MNKSLDNGKAVRPAPPGEPESLAASLTRPPPRSHGDWTPEDGLEPGDVLPVIWEDDATIRSHKGREVPS